MRQGLKKTGALYSQMGGSGSGSWYRWDSRATTESQHRIDIRWLKKKGYIRPGATGCLVTDTDIGSQNFERQLLIIGS